MKIGPAFFRRYKIELSCGAIRYEWAAHFRAFGFVFYRVDAGPCRFEDHDR